MKILSVNQVREADAFTITHEPVSDLDLMERAALQLFNWFLKNIPVSRPVQVFCGQGNNGGDGLVLSRLLSQYGYRCMPYLVEFSNKLSPSCMASLERYLGMKDQNLVRLKPGDTLQAIPAGTLVVDALFGSGLNKPLDGYAAEIVQHINKSGTEILAIDVPSGFFCDQPNDKENKAVIRAKYTLTFQFPKLGFLFPENYEFVGDFTVLPIGLHLDFIEHVKTTDFFIEQDDCKKLMKKRTVFSHKGAYGHGLLIAGSYGKTGAAVLGAKAALRSGTGLVTVHVPGCGYTVIQTSVPEAMVSIDENEKVFSSPPSIGSFNAIAAGPGIGTAGNTANALKLLIQNSACPLILDADAINILAENKTWLSFLPSGSILTPHPGEFKRLSGNFDNDFERNRVQRELSAKYRLYIILKGAYTAITTPEGDCFFNSTGNPGMATGGSGDVLTGILLGLMAQGYSLRDACILGTFIHGRAGDLALVEQSPESLISGDIIENLGKAFKTLY